MKRIFIIAALSFCALGAGIAQGEMQALRYSSYTPFGSARFAAQGAATAALGGDMGAVFMNPAGLAFYRSSEISFSPSLYWVNTEASFMGSTTEEFQTKFNMGSLGLVKARQLDKRRGIVGLAYSFGYNTLVNFNNRTLISGNNTNSSLLDDFTWHANTYPDQLDPYYEQLAFDASLMPYDKEAGTYWHDMQIDGYGQSLNRLSEQYGYIGEYSMSGAMNVANLLYVGATLGLHSLRFSEDIVHTETDANNNVMDFKQFTFKEYNNTNGWGYTARFGLILRPVQVLRIGASFQLPTIYHLSDQKSTRMSSQFDSGSGINDQNVNSPSGLYDYKLRTPFEFGAQASLLILKQASLSLAYTYKDYSSSRLSASDYAFFDENGRIGSGFRAAHNLRAGAEVRLSPLYLRAGMQHLMSPFSDKANNAEMWIFSGGLGVRGKRNYFDLSYSYGSSSEVYGMYAYEPGINEVANISLTKHILMCTLGFRF
ncbi:MAG: hypothetical protein CSA96_05130 [Bacteroidetes bacterium]|nr:MAG: hypothetical protein CSA96_05130 [Bacteroidota bacterium]